MERFSLPHTQPFAAARQIACRIRTYGITLVRLHAFPFLPDNAYRFRLPRIWNPSFMLEANVTCQWRCSYTCFRLSSYLRSLNRGMILVSQYSIASYLRSLNRGMILVALYSIALYSIALYSIALYSIALCSIALYSILQFLETMAEIVREGIDKASKGLYLEEQNKLAQEVSIGGSTRHSIEFILAYLYVRQPHQTSDMLTNFKMIFLHI